MKTIYGFFLEMSSFFHKITISNVGRDSIPAVDNVQKSSNIYDNDDNEHL